MAHQRRVLASGFIVAFVVSVLATPAGAEWKRLDTPNFVVVGDVGAGDLRTIARNFEAFRETLSRVLTQGATAAAVPTMVMVFPSDNAFTPFKPRYNGKPVELTGLFIPRQDANYIAVVRNLDEHAMRIVFHEYAHLLISNASGVVPVWLNEGLAEFYSTFEMMADGREVLIGKTVPGHIPLLNERRLLPLEELLNVKQDSPLYNEGDRRSTFYAQSWALTHLIMLGQPSRRDKLAAYLDRLSSGVPEMDAWKQAFGADQMNRELNAYIGRQLFSAYRVKFSDKLNTFDGVPVTPVPRSSSEALLANFLVQQHRNEEALQRLDKLAPPDANTPWVTLVRASLDSTRTDGSAMKALMALDPADDWLLGYFAGATLAEAIENRQGDIAAAEVDAVKRFFEVATKSGREIPNVLARTLSLELMKGERPSDRTMLAFRRALTLAPGRADYLFLYARGLAQRSSYPAAISLVRSLTGDGYPQHVREAAKRALETLERAQREQTASAAAATNRYAADPTATDRETSGAAPGAFQPVFRKLEEGEQRFEGMLQRLECSKGAAVFHISTPGGPILARAASLDQVDFITYRKDLSGSIGCGAQKEQMPVYVTWRPAADGKGDRIAVAIEFLPKPESNR